MVKICLFVAETMRVNSQCEICLSFENSTNSTKEPLFKLVKRLEREEKGWKAWQRWRGLAGQAPIFIKTPAKQPPVLSLKANYREKVVKDCC